MPLRSQLFSGDPKLEAAATSDASHITPGSSGEHVRKIQLALIQLDGALIDADGKYGPKTAAAVLSYKQKRDIVNRSRQTTADNIVGIMTMASLDSEILNDERILRGPVRIRPVSFSRVRAPRQQQLLSLLESSQPFGVNGSSPAFGVNAPRVLPGLGSGSGLVIELQRDGRGSFVVENGSPGEVVVADSGIARISQDGAGSPIRDRERVINDSQGFRIFAGKILGSTTITATSGDSTATIEVVVKTFVNPPEFHPGINHDHKASGQYNKVQENPNNNPTIIGRALNIACPLMSPEQLVTLAKGLVFVNKPIALKHLDFYLSIGKGADFNEDRNIADWLRRDSGIRRRLKREIFPRGRRPRAEGKFLFLQEEYANEDFQHAFGAIDRVDYEVDFSRDTVRVWFQDRYEWHPFYPFYNPQVGTAEFPFSADGVRETNCLHAALVELKASGAADFWMKGQGEINLSLIAAS